MARVPMIENREQASPVQVEAFDHIAASRGRMIPPYAAMLHRPALARAAADLGAVIRFEGVLTDHDRELVILTTAIERDCRYEWESHLAFAEAAGVSSRSRDEIAAGVAVTDPTDGLIVDFVRQLSREGKVREQTFQEARSRLGVEGVVELTTTIGYYTMLSLFMNACEVC